VTAGRRLATLEHSACTIQSLSITAQDRILSTCATVRLWDERSGKLLRTWLPKVGSFATMAAAADDGAQVLTSGLFGELQLWDTSEEYQPITSIYGAPAAQQAVAIAFSPGGRYFISVSQGGSIKVWDAPTAGNRVLRRANRDFHNLRQTPDGSRLLLDDDEGLELLDAKTGRGLARAPASLTAIAVHPQSGLIGGALTDRRISLWTSELSPIEQTLGPTSGPISFLAFDPRRPRIAAGTDSGEVEIWDLERRTRIASTSVGSGVNHLAYSADGSRLAAAVGHPPPRIPRTGGALRILDGATGRPAFASIHPEGTGRAFLTLAFSPDGGRILAGTFNRSVVYDLEARELAQFSESPAVMGAAFTPDGTRALVVHSNGVLESWDPRTWDLVAKFYGQGAGSLLLSPDGSRLYVGSGRVQVYSTELFHPREERRPPPRK